jgi:putative Mn2+ efflux pump MntP
VGLDVLALSVGVGVIDVSWSARAGLGTAFSAAEVLMQVAAYVVSNAAGRITGGVAVYIGFGVLAGVGAFIIRESFETGAPTFRADSGWGCSFFRFDQLGFFWNRCRCQAYLCH